MSSPEPLLGRYRFVKRLKGSAKLIAWLAEDPSGQQVVAGLLSAGRVDGLRAAQGLAHPHLSTVLEIADSVDAAMVPEGPPIPDNHRIVVAEFVPGRSLARRVGTGPVDPARAVRWIARLCRALARMHALGAVHGAVSPRSLVVSRVTRGPSPVLTHLIAPPSGTYCSPERVTGSGPTMADDVWALSATLYTALTRRPPFIGNSRKELAGAILRNEVSPPTGVDADLRELVMRGLDRQASYRFSDVIALGDALEHWLGTHEPASSPIQQPTEESTVSELSGAFDLDRQAGGGEAGEDTSTDASIIAAAASVRPSDLADRATTPPIRGSDATDRLAAPGRPQGAAQSKRRNWWLAAPVLMLAVGAGSYGLSRIARRSPDGPSRARAAPEPAQTPTNPDLGASAVPAHQATTPHRGLPDATPERRETKLGEVPIRQPNETVAECVGRLLPAGTLGSTPDLQYLCNSTELWATGRRLHSHIARHGGGDGLKLWAFLGEYDLPAIAVLRNACCPEADGPEAATPSTACGSLTNILRDIAGQPTPHNLDRYEKAVACLAARQVRLPEVWDRVREQTGRETFERFLQGARTRARSK